MDKWVGDRMVEITEAEQNKEKNNEKKKWGQSQRPRGQHRAPTFEL